jgi:serine/threonine protein kinase/tetratricopeptide (TPR) repeat protein
VAGDNWDRVQELFLTAADLPDAEQVAWLDSACNGDASLRSEVESLLRADRTGGAPLDSAIRSMASSVVDDPPLTGLRLGVYRVVREIGRGGIGAVYLAERDDDLFHKQVAIKIVKRGMDTAEILSRFRHERQILANLDHPYIARLIDGGTTPDGRPFFVMEYVEGKTIDVYCREREMGVEARIELFLKVCEAVSYAHRSLVVHRDLKPGNILVTADGIPKLLDFGVAKLLTPGEEAITTTVFMPDRTSMPGEPGPLGMEIEAALAGRLEQTGATLTMGGTLESGFRILTPAYASPEQVRGEPVTVASDIYSLAVALYELLTGMRAHCFERHTPLEIEQVVCEDDVPRASEVVEDKALAKRLAGDLDTILQRALDKDAKRRYASMEQFSDDLRRHLTHQPVLARADTIRYRLLKFVRRRRGLVVAVTAVTVSLVAGVVISEREARTARENLMQVRHLANAFVFNVHDAVRDLPGSTRARQLIIQTGLQYLDALAKNSRGDWTLRMELAAAYQRIGDVQGDVMDANLGNTAAALESYRKAMALLEPVIAHDPGNRKARLDRIAIQARMGGVYSYMGNNRQALASYREAQKLCGDLLAGNPLDGEVRRQLAAIDIGAGEALRLTGEYAASLAENSRALALLAESAAVHPNDRALQQTLGNAYAAVGMSEVRMGRFGEGLERYRQAQALIEQLCRMEPTNATYRHDLMQVYTHMGDVLGNPNRPSMGDPDGAEEAYGQMLEVARRLYESDPADQRAVSDYAIALSREAAVLPKNRLWQRISLLRESLKLLHEVGRINPQNAINQWDMAHGYSLLGNALMDAGERVEGMQAYHHSLDLAEELLKAGVMSPVPTLVDVSLRMGEEAAGAGNREFALAHARRALELCDAGGVWAKGRPEAVQKFLTPEGYAAMGLVHARLALLQEHNGTARTEDRAQALIWLRKSQAAWRAVQSDATFGPPQRRQMQHVDDMLAQLMRRRRVGD